MWPSIRRPAIRRRYWTAPRSPPSSPAHARRSQLGCSPVPTRARWRSWAPGAGLAATLEVTVRAAADYAAALAGADIACATTYSVEPVIRREWLSPGTHVTSVGYNRAGREIDDATVADALVCVESRAAALAPFPAGSNDLLEPIRNGVITAEHVHAELGELAAGTRPGRSSPTQITLYKSVGVAVQDAVAVALTLTAARARHIGTTIDL